MEIGEDAVEGLSLLDSHIKASVVGELASAALSVLLCRLSEEAALSIPAFEHLQVDLIKRTYSALICLFVEAAKNDLSPSHLSAFLTTDCGLNPTAVDEICSAFLHHKADLTRSLSLTANHSYLRRLQGVDWSLDYCVSSSQDRTAREFLYNIRFKTFDVNSGKEDWLEVSCSPEDLQDLISRLRDACKSVKRVVDCQ